ncbi:hypothetical protein ACFWFU_02950 [Streptomyces sp. NPDC060235]|uniref:hypothetical protein n=1 Tax=Streptomyces sp. NPDC060235 TaxID=3347080 RepID=UPI00364B5CB3
MTLRFIAKDPNTNGDNCPTVWVDEKTNDFIIQGWKADEATERECLETGTIPDTEAVVRLSARMVAAIREACDAADGAALR